MSQKTLFIIILLILIGCNNCDSIKGKNTTVNININRFDKELYESISTDQAALQQQIKQNYASMLNVIGLSIFNIQDTQTDVFFDRLINYYSEPTLNKLYQDALETFENIESIQENLSKAFGYQEIHFPSMQIPAVYMHVSGLQQNILIDDSLLSISIDKYLGADYPLYTDFFYDHQRKKMDPVYVAPDYFSAWLMSEYPFKGDDRVLLDRMIYDGKIKYILHEALPQLIPETLMGYAPTEYQWCKQNEKEIWKLIIERKHLYTPDHVTTSKYFSSAPSIFISDDAPGELGTWIGWQIVTSYMNNNNITPEQLMINVDYQDILTKAKYKP